MRRDNVTNLRESHASLDQFRLLHSLALASAARHLLAASPRVSVFLKILGLQRKLYKTIQSIKFVI